MSLHTEIDNLTHQLLTIGALVEKRVLLAVKSVDTRDVQLAEHVIEGDQEIDGMEVALEEECLKILALYQPVAVDLRVIIAVIKINNDLERIGDLAADIAERGYYFGMHEAVELPFDFPDMSQKVRNMLQKSLDAIVNLDGDVAKNVCTADDAVDDLHKHMFQQVGEAIQDQPHYIEQFIGYLSVSRFLERIADHATNIAEDVIYLIEGDIVRHKGK